VFLSNLLALCPRSGVKNAKCIVAGLRTGGGWRLMQVEHRATSSLHPWGSFCGLTAVTVTVWCSERLCYWLTGTAGIYGNGVVSAVCVCVLGVALWKAQTVPSGSGVGPGGPTFSLSVVLILVDNAELTPSHQTADIRSFRFGVSIAGV
jgi:hypothetical protein